ncbi:YcgL domain-containing protein [Halomonas alkaliantarctica]|uniref:YcgL domain-containing protein QEN58_12095 n=1 Tax=Halomonas alkaliantarctica TaxID=232346 RepID=A0ABY8LKH7_9GAMM|nr:YcgL domain-containing protein [Halomonas alkaliantarctica]WGI24082.1 YcgL domain-containing protein [Halomonas alkaliantarctica]
MSDKLICEVFKSSRKDEMYLYVDKRQGLADVPEQLLETFGKPVPVFTMLLTADKKLSRVNAADVVDGIKDKGFYLQMPPAKEAYLLDVHRAHVASRSDDRTDEQ